MVDKYTVQGLVEGYITAKRKAAEAKSQKDKKKHEKNAEFYRDLVEAYSGPIEDHLDSPDDYKHIT